MVSITKIIGGPGTGKTRRSMEIIESLGRLGITPMDVGFASFTKIAVRTAADKAEGKFGIESSTLMGQGGWFRTLHSACYHMLGVKQNQMLTDKPESLRWLSEVFGVEVTATGVDADTGAPVMTGNLNDVSSILGWWGYCRNALIPIQDALRYAPVSRSDIEQMIAKIKHYERRKLLDKRLDFADLPLLVAGIRHGVTEIDRVRPIGSPPCVRAWILDEYQDTFPAIHAAALRITSHPDVEHIYCLGDPFQSIFGFSSGNPRYLMSGWPYTAEDMMHQSFRCPPPVMNLAERTIANCSDYFDRCIKPRVGSVGRTVSTELRYSGPSRVFEGTWLFLARTNSQAMQIGRWLNKGNVPWRSIAGDHYGYLNPRHRLIARSIIRLHKGQSITSSEWMTVADAMNSHAGGTPLLRPGFKVDVKQGVVEGLNLSINLSNLTRNGGTEQLVEILASQQWNAIYRQADKIRMFDKAQATYGESVAMAPKVVVGTIHASKGDEADNVVLYDNLSQRCRGNLISTDQSAADEEYRVWYVGVTRAREALYTARFPNDRFPMYRRF